ncbi:MAG TPA: GFA family protein [Steroidobacteraceae bacterium]|nr:GFA family protein [Steroidobacteraceae bacterium]
MKYQGGCHCGRIKFEVEGELKNTMTCNCSICSRKGAVMWFVPRDSMHLLTPDDAASTYTFNKHIIKHRFCPVCGMHPYGEGSDQQGNRMAAINVRCLDDVDLSAIPTQQFDGRSM